MHYSKSNIVKDKLHSIQQFKFWHLFLTNLTRHVGCLSHSWKRYPQEYSLTRRRAPQKRKIKTEVNRHMVCWWIYHASVYVVSSFNPMYEARTFHLKGCWWATSAKWRGRLSASICMISAFFASLIPVWLWSHEAFMKYCVLKVPSKGNNRCSLNKVKSSVNVTELNLKGFFPNVVFATEFCSIFPNMVVPFDQPTFYMTIQIAPPFLEWLHWLSKTSYSPNC